MYINVPVVSVIATERQLRGNKPLIVNKDKKIRVFSVLKLLLRCLRWQNIHIRLFISTLQVDIYDKFNKPFDEVYNAPPFPSCPCPITS